MGGIELGIAGRGVWFDGAGQMDLVSSRGVNSWHMGRNSPRNANCSIGMWTCVFCSYLSRFDGRSGFFCGGREIIVCRLSVRGYAFGACLEILCF